MISLKTAAAILAVTLLTTTAAQAKHHRHHHTHHRGTLRGNDMILDGHGNVVSHKTGAHATVGAAYASKFQAYIDKLEQGGATVYFMGGIRHGRCWSGGLHPCGKALDVCQLSRGRVDSKCHLPSRARIAQIAESVGLFEGGQWCNSDYGHAQVGVSAAACGERTYAARSRHARQQVAFTGAVDRLNIH